MRTLVSLAAVAMLLTAIPAGADPIPPAPVSQPCTQDQVEAADYVLTTNGLTEVVPTPTAMSPYPLGLGGEPDPLGFQEAATDVYTILLDVNPDHVAATPNVSLMWEHTGDIDMDIYSNGQLVGESHSFNPQDGNGENASAGKVKHCATFEVHIRNYISTPGDITMDVTLSSLRTS